MPTEVIYLDSNATTRPAPEVVATMAQAEEELWANPSSVHRFGQRVRQQVELARESVARLINADPAEVVFTSSGTESTNLAIFGTARRRPDRPVIVTTPIEHSAVREPVEQLGKEGFTVVNLPASREGLVDPDDLVAVLREHEGQVNLVTIQWANNEMGAIQPIAPLLEVTRAADGRIIFHTDAIQWVGKMPTDVRSVPVDLLSLAGHKFHGPKGIGALYVRRGVRIAPMLYGGPHERQRRGGTENVAGIIGLGVAAQLAAQRLTTESTENTERGRDLGAGDRKPQATSRKPGSPPHSLRDSFERRILETIPDTAVNGPTAPESRIWNTTNIAFDRLEAEAILLLLSERGVCASAGAACSSGSLDPSPVLLAMGVPPRLAHGSIRFSLSHETTKEELDRAFDILESVIARLRKVLPVG